MSNNKNGYFVESATDARYVTALARGLMVLHCFDEEITQLTHQQLCEKTGLPKATISRLIFTLMATGYLTQGSKNTYQVGINALKLGHIASILYDISNITNTTLKAFAIAHQVSVNIATHHNGMMRYVACYRSPARISVNLEVGSEVPIASTAIGRAFYATADTQTQATLLDNLQQRLSPVAYQQALQQLYQADEFYQRHQYVLSDGEFMAEIMAIAVGVPSHTPNQLPLSLPHYSINVSVPSSQWQVKDLIKKMLPDLQSLAIEINQQLSSL